MPNSIENLAIATRSILLSLALVSLALLAAPAVAEVCFGDAPIEPNDSRRYSYFDPAPLAVDLPQTGILKIRVSSPSRDEPQPLLSLVDIDCGEGSARRAGHTVLERTLGHLVLAVHRPGLAAIQVAAQAGNQALGQTRIDTTFVEIPNLRPPMKGGEDDEEIEVDANSNAHLRPGLYSPNIDSGGEDDEEIEVDANASSLQLPGIRRSPLCRPSLDSGMDDHADGFACATPLELSRTLEGRLANGWGDDYDVFRLELGQPDPRRFVQIDLWRLKIEARGDSALVATLYDARGHRLEPASSLGTGDLHLEQTIALTSGVYFLRIEGFQGAESRYQIRATASRP